MIPFNLFNSFQGFEEAGAGTGNVYADIALTRDRTIHRSGIDADLGKWCAAKSHKA